MTYHYPHKSLKRYKENRLGFFGALEQIYYELKPLILAGISVYALRTVAANSLYVKYASVGVIVFCIYVVWSRLNSRGII